MICGVIDREVATEADVVRFAPKNARAQGVKRRDPHGATIRIEQLLDPLTHFLRGLVREGDRHDLIGIRDLLGYEIRDAMRDDARLSRPGAREDE